jgi:hypothetical protein
MKKKEEKRRERINKLVWQVFKANNYFGPIAPLVTLPLKIFLFI